VHVQLITPAMHTCACGIKTVASTLTTAC